jgi:L-lysine exporter family protein LysE/ArgO
MTEVVIAILHGLFLAIGLLLPLGAQNIFIFNQGAMQPNFTKALPCIITASICDSMLIMAGVLGISILMLKLVWLKLTIFITGFFFLIYMGYITWKQPVHGVTKNHHIFSTKRQIVFAASTSLLNPHAIIDTIAVIGTNSIEYAGKAKIAYTITCILVSWIWFSGLAVAGRSLHKIDKNGFWIKIINKIAATIIWIVAFYLAIQIIGITL